MYKAIRKRILIIDDAEDILEILDILLQQKGYEVILSSTTDVVVNIATIKPDLLLLDVRLTGSDKSGLDICQDLKEQLKEQHFPIILISAEDNLHDIYQDCQADGYIKKPFDIEVLYSTIDSFLEEHKDVH